MSTAELGQMFVKGADAWPPEAWAILEEEVARRERAARVSRLQIPEASTADGGAPAKPRFGVLSGALLAFVGLVGVGYCAFVKSPTGVPACDSAAAESVVRDAIENSVDARLVNHRLLALQGQSEVSYHKAKLERRCKAKAILNSGPIAINYRLYKLSPTDATVFVEVTEQ
jgi:hypothetical protein